MKKLYLWFQNQSLHIRMIVPIFIVVAVLQIFNGFLFTKMVSEKLQENISQANLVAVEQMAVNLNQAFINVVNGMVLVRSEIAEDLFSVKKQSYINRDIQYRKLFNDLLAANENYSIVHSMLVLDDSRGQNYCYAKVGTLLLSSSDLFGKIVEDYSLEEQCCWSGIIKENYFFERGEKKLISIIMPVNRNGEIKELLLVNLEVDVLLDYLQTSEETDSILFLQMNETDFLTESENWSITPKQEKELLAGFQDWNNIENIGNYWVISSEVVCNSWKLSILVPNDIISENAGVLSRYILVIMLSTGIVLVFSVSFIVFMVTKPVKKMRKIMEANRHSKEMNYRFHAKYRDEVGVLAETYNKLMDEIQQLMLEIEQEQIQRRKTYQRMLQMQIKPHFLYNTLETAKFLVEMGDPNGTEMLAAIGKFYKLSLSGVEDFITIKGELEQLKYYLLILKLRYSSRYEYSIDVQEEILENEIVRFSLQPLVENAVYHGIKQKRGKGFVKIMGYKENQELYLVIWDNGAGIQKEQLEQIQKQLSYAGKKPLSEHIGIINVHQRIRMYYGESYGLTVESEEGEFTRIEIRIPSKERKE